MRGQNSYDNKAITDSLSFLENVYDENRFRELIDEGFNVNEPKVFGRSSPMEFFLETYPLIFNPDTVDANYIRKLFRTAQVDNTDVILKCFERFKDEDRYFEALKRLFESSQKSESGFSEAILLEYLKDNHVPRVVEMLLELGSDPNARSLKQGTLYPYLGTPLQVFYHEYFAAGEDCKKCVKLLLDYGADIFVSDCNGYTPIHTYASEPEVIKLFLEKYKNADINIRNGRYGITPLGKTIFDYHMLLQHKDKIKEKIVEAIRMFIEQGADVNIITRRVNTSNGWVYILGDIRITSVESAPLIHWSALTMDTDIVGTLLEAGADATVVDTQERTPVHMLASVYSTASLNSELLKLFVEYGVDINAQDLDGKTILHYLGNKYTEKNSPEYQKCLEDFIITAINLGADPEIRSLHGLQAWECPSNKRLRTRFKKLCQHSLSVKKELDANIDLYER